MDNFLLLCYVMLRFLSSLFYFVNFAQYKSTLALSVTILFLRQMLRAGFQSATIMPKVGDVIAQIMIEGKTLESQFFSSAENDNDNSNNSF